MIGVDARAEPIEMTRQFELKPDLLLDARHTSAEEAVKEILKLRPDDYDGWDGADGKCSDMVACMVKVDISCHTHRRPPLIPAIRSGYRTSPRTSHRGGPAS